MDKVEAYQNLANAIIIQACEDYKTGEITDDSFERFECNDAVERLLPYLQPEEQEIVKLSYAGYKGVEIAKIMGCSRQNVSARQKRIHNFAKRQLWKEMMAD